MEKELEKPYLTNCNLLISQKFMVSSLSNHVYNLIEGNHKIKCKHGHGNKKCEACGIKYKVSWCYLQYTNIKDDSIQYKCCNRNCQKKFDENLKERFANTYKFSNHHINKFSLLLRKSVYPYESIDDWKNSIKHHYQRKKIFTVT